MALFRKITWRQKFLTPLFRGVEEVCLWQTRERLQIKYHLNSLPTDSCRCSARPWSASGFSYVEVLLCSVIISIILVSGLRLFGNLGRSRQVLLDQSSADFLALQMVEEIKQQFYKDPDGSLVFGRELDESAPDRSDFDDVDDYRNFSESPPTRRNGAVLSQYDVFTRAVSVCYVAADDFTQPAVSDEGFKEITITVSRSGQILAQQIYVLADIFVGIR